MKLKILIFSVFYFPIYSLVAQTYEVGTSYFSANDYIEYLPGNLPIILSAAHGGDLKPSNIPDRNCTGCVYVKDSFTQELSREIAENIATRTGCYPHVIINRLHRTKLDANRAVGEAADGDPIAEEAWEAYHDFIELAQDTIEENFQRGLFLDIHGHGHTIQRLELGYLLSKNDLQLGDEELAADNFVNKSSIKNLANDNLMNLDFVELIRGENSFGSLMSTLGYDAVPSTDDLFALDSEAYFSGGYNTAQYGSRDNGPTDAIQIECNQDVRFQEQDRKKFADSLTLAILEFYQTHYNDRDITSLCQVVTTKEISDYQLNIYPNPARGSFTIRKKEGINNISLYDAYGIMVAIFESDNTNEMTCDISDLKEGLYVALVKSENQILTTKILVHK